ncbi:hypothetical protein MIND_00615900 [Mycena indigotica]|uniref:Acetoin reductase family protein n=1 Tax=Mycena indigotica TaxID=2126181 RepID=A0A8H6SPZ4_9AGAR|nr:uncharacterized protein MIND_00615900 [Mycena indigotica]KAF7303860.1 hypothetical protein MIND_00615900 [Mycena indigotica]
MAAESPLKSKGIAIVTGAGQGIGRVIALRLANDGFTVVANDITANASKLDGLIQEINSLGGSSWSCIANISVEEDVQKMVAEAVSHFPGEKLTVMVANAGIARYDTIFDLSAADFDAVMTVNARGCFLCYKYAAQQMIQQNSGGRIIGASSMCGKKGYEGLSAYCASKFAIRGLTQAAALELGKHQITVNAYAPGAIETSMLDQLASWSTTASGGAPQNYFDTLKARTPLGIIGDPTDVANVVAFLASEESRFITGQTISVNGGTFFD